LTNLIDILSIDNSLRGPFCGHLEGTFLSRKVCWHLTA